ncbi:hypothetical protein OPV22_033947 [Ensete ventricosum]|uniref:Uncharacterized protein n=1 Tax=Ensete ventricosum TaxID=4639 RepID=A0AAV8P1B4_ENSVE|nr:hypothetical protein OPV22_033947 [Ensete ventricosum]
MDVKCNHCLHCGPGNPCGHQLRFCAIKEDGCEGAVKKQKRVGWTSASSANSLTDSNDFEKSLGIAADSHM